MSSIVSGALAGMASEQQGNGHEEATTDKMQERHATLIKELMPKMAKIQREMKGRRFRVSCYWVLATFSYRNFTRKLLSSIGL